MHHDNYAIEQEILSLWYKWCETRDLEGEPNHNDMHLFCADLREQHSNLLRKWKLSNPLADKTQEAIALIKEDIANKKMPVIRPTRDQLMRALKGKR
jgi:hypothetical protein